MSARVLIAYSGDLGEVAELEHVVGARLDQHHVGALDVDGIELLQHAGHVGARARDVDHAGMRKGGGDAPAKAVINRATARFAIALQFMFSPGNMRV